MAFIPITAKADIKQEDLVSGYPTSTTKKGKITPTQMAQINAWGLVEKVGILDCLGKCEATAETYNISQGKATVLFKKGYIVIYGIMFECEQETPVEIDTNATPNGKIVLSVRLENTKQGEFFINYISNSTITYNEDLNENPITGKYDFVLYEYQTVGETLQLKKREQKYIPYLGDRVKEVINGLYDTGKPLNGYDESKGTIEERLTNLGFKQGSMSTTQSDGDITLTKNIVNRQGNYVIGELRGTIRVSSVGTNAFTLGMLSKDFRPGTKLQDFWVGVEAHTPITTYPRATMVFHSNGIITLQVASDLGTGNIDLDFAITFGFEALPITNKGE